MPQPLSGFHPCPPHSLSPSLLPQQGRNPSEKMAPPSRWFLLGYFWVATKPRGQREEDLSQKEEAKVQGTGKPPVSSDAVKRNGAPTALRLEPGGPLVKAQAEPQLAVDAAQSLPLPASLTWASP